MSPYANWEYSWISPPRRSRRSTRDNLGAVPTRSSETDATGATVHQWWTDLLSTLGAPLADSGAGGAGELTWLLADDQGTITDLAAVVNGVVTLTGSATLDPFGGDLTVTGTSSGNPIRFHAQYLDEVTGLYDIRARDYDPGSGRFTAIDPVHPQPGTAYTQTYHYGHSNPAHFADPTGEYPIVPSGEPAPTFTRPLDGFEGLRHLPGLNRSRSAITDLCVGVGVLPRAGRVRARGAIFCAVGSPGRTAMGQIVRSSGRIVMAVVAACGTVVAAQGTAHAAWAFNDNMEIHFGVPPQNRFSFDSNTNWRGSFIFSPQNEEQSSEAHSPSHYAYLSTGTPGLTWTSVGRSVTIPAAPNGGRRTCQFHAWVRAGFQQFNIEVIDPATWDYITVKKVRSPMWTWDVISTNNFTAASTVFVRVALLSPGYTATARVDDFTVLCS